MRFLELFVCFCVLAPSNLALSFDLSFKAKDCVAALFEQLDGLGIFLNKDVVLCTLGLQVRLRFRKVSMQFVECDLKLRNFFVCLCVAFAFGSQLFCESCHGFLFISELVAHLNSLNFQHFSLLLPLLQPSSKLQSFSIVGRLCCLARVFQDFIFCCQFLNFAFMSFQQWLQHRDFTLCFCQLILQKSNTLFSFLCVSTTCADRHLQLQSSSLSFIRGFRVQVFQFLFHTLELPPVLVAQLLQRSLGLQQPSNFCLQLCICSQPLVSIRKHLFALSNYRRHLNVILFGCLPRLQRHGIEPLPECLDLLLECSLSLGSELLLLRHFLSQPTQLPSE
mmetsp:Transcript_27350/g.63068  ORF Transcript_27350/g.63068 Transcript_27350/m.63068 type:complete len:335 (+) Transcript_27350:843-1847(+)